MEDIPASAGLADDISVLFFHVGGIMRTNFLLAAAVIVIGSVIGVSASDAGSPALSDGVWNLSPMELNDCVQQAKTALVQVGAKNVNQQTPSTVLGFVGGEIGDYNLVVICFTMKNVLVTQVTGSDFKTATAYREQLDRKMGFGGAPPVKRRNGEWSCVANCGCSPTIGNPMIEQEGTSLTLTNECGQQSRGEIVGSNSLKAFDWSVTANIEGDGTRIRFSNGTVWER